MREYFSNDFRVLDGRDDADFTTLGLTSFHVDVEHFFQEPLHSRRKLFLFCTGQPIIWRA